MRLCAVIVAGGRSSRMGREKAFVLLHGRSILDRVTACLRPQVKEIVVNANGETARFGELGFSIVADIRSDIATPLAGVHAALAHGREMGCDAVLTVPCDAPFLPADLAARLLAARRPAAIAASAGQQHYLTALWSTSLLSQMAMAMDEPRVPRLQDWCRMCDAAIVKWPVDPYDPFFNVNTPEDLAEAERIAAKFGL